MRRIGLCLCLFLPAVQVVRADDDRPALLLTGGRILNVIEGRLMPGLAVFIDGDRISKVAPTSEITVPGDVRRIDIAGLVLMPGLIDLHTHLLLRPYDEAPWNDQVLEESLALRTIRAVVAARSTLEAGFTTIRDLGTEGAGYADVGLRDAIDQGIITGPRVFTVTRALVATGCYGPSGFDPRWDMPVGAEVADGPVGIRKAVRSQIAAGADWIKVYADYRRKPGDRSTPTFSQEELNALVDEARSAGLRVAAHAVTNEAIRRSVRAGVATIEHGTEASEAVLAMMLENNVVLCPTLAASEAMARYSGWTPGAPDHPRIVRSKEMFARALRSGVTIACGSDAGVFAHGDNLREVELMVAYGMTPAQALAASTHVAAGVLDRANDLGRVAEGYLADLIAVRGNPLSDVSLCRKPALVIKGGRIVIDR
ncbi:MAG: amidohydrolase family protein [Planctomycetes bacterium]|nr:amidohydrolase family protein [Planctomycetota bacterium]